LKVCLGTPSYMAPEVLAVAYNTSLFKTFTYDQKCDMWSFGVMVYAILTGGFPFDRDDFDEQRQLVQAGMFSFEGKETSKGARNFISLCLLVDPKERPTAAELRAHPWLQRDHHADSSPVAAEVVGGLRRYAAMSIFKKYVMLMVAQAYGTDHDKTQESFNMFREIDKTRRGMVSYAEFKAVLPTVSDEDARKIFDSIDVAREGYISLTEFHAAMLATLNELSPKELMVAFMLMNGGKEKKLLRKDLEKVLAQQLPGLEQQSLDEVMQALDTDEDGCVSFEEFCHFFDPELTSQFM